MFVSASEIGSLLRHPRAAFPVTLTAGGGWNVLPHPGGESWVFGPPARHARPAPDAPTPHLYSESAWTTTTRLVPAPRRAGRDSLSSASSRLRPPAAER